MYSILDESSNKKSTNKSHNAFIEFQEFLRYTISEKDSQTSNKRNKV